MTPVTPAAATAGANLVTDQGSSTTRAPLTWKERLAARLQVQSAVSNVAAARAERDEAAAGMKRAESELAKLRAALLEAEAARDDSAEAARVADARAAHAERSVSTDVTAAHAERDEATAVAKRKGGPHGTAVFDF